jgi:hypothetical protein
MAIQNDDAVGLGQAAQPAPRQQPQQQAGTQAAQSAPPAFNLFGGNLFAAPIGRGVGSEVLSKIQKGLQEHYAQASKEYELQVLSLDNVNEPALAFSVLVVAGRLVGAMNRLAYHIVVVEATGDRIAPYFENIHNTQIEVVRTTADAYDNILVAKVENKLKQAYPGLDAYINAEATVVPRTFDPENKDAIHKLSLNAGLAVFTYLNVTSKTFTDFNLATGRDESQLIVDVRFSDQPQEDLVGEPVRADFAIAFNAQRQGGQNNRSINAGDRQLSLTNVSGFFDVVWAPVAGGNVFQNPWMPQQNVPTQKYVARAIMTDLMSNFSYTPGAVLLAIATTMALRDDNNWVQAFRPKPIIGNDVDLRDIGALNIEANLMNDPSGYGQPIDTKAESFRLENLGQLVSSLFQPGLIMSIDVPDAGPNSWFLSMFAAAAKGNTSAQKVIFESAQDLTNGEFEKYFSLGDQMFVDVDNRVHLGHWIDRNGIKRDIREIDYLAVANLIGSRDPVRCRAWSDTWTRDDYPLIQRMAERKKIITALTSDSAVITGFANRVTFSAKLMDALTQGCRDAGLVVRINTPLSSADFNTNRGVARFASDALLGASGRSFNQYGATFNPQYASAAGNFSRWST